MRIGMDLVAGVAAFFLLLGSAAGEPPPTPEPVGDLNSVMSWTRTFIGYYEKNFPDLKIDHSLCTGQVPASRMDEAEALMGRINSALTTTRSSYKRVSAGDKQKPWVAQRLAVREYASSCMEAFEQQKKAAKEAEAAGQARLKKMHFDFMKAVGDQSRTIQSLIGWADGKSGGLKSVTDPDTLTRIKSDLEKIHTVCTTTFKDIENDPRYAVWSKQNPELICKLGAMGKEVVEKLALNYVNESVGRMVKDMEEEAEKLPGQNGYIHLVGTIQKQAMFDPQAVKKELTSRFGPVLAAAGLQADDKVFAGFDAARSKLWKVINETAPRWKAPKKQGNERKAVAAAKKSFSGSGQKVVKAYTTRGSWQIIKNALGIPLRRTKPGYILYKVNSDKAHAGKLCRGRSFTYTETYDGRRYQKADTVTELGYIRFESCR